MGPAKRTGKVPKFQRTPVFRVDYDGVFPSEILNSLVALPETLPFNQADHIESDQPPTKRPRLASDYPRAICVSEGRVHFQRRYVEVGQPSWTTSRQHVGSEMKCHLSDTNDELHMNFLSQGGHGLTGVVSLGPDEVDRNSPRVIQMINLTMQDSQDPSAVWSTTDVSIDCHDNLVSIEINFRVYWNESCLSDRLRTKRERIVTQSVIDWFFPQPASDSDGCVRSPTDFYEAAYVPPKDDPLAASIVIDGLETTLYPYQRRTLRWMLDREKAKWDISTSTVLPTASSEGTRYSTIMFRTVQDVDGNHFYLSDLHHVITSNPDMYQNVNDSVRGGILAEEMGLGKTLEILSLILLHTRPQSDITTPESNLFRKSGATLIVVPESLRSQWMFEIARHAPELRFKHYKGCKNVSKWLANHMTEELSQLDIVITTYNVLRAELYFAKEPPQRSLRHDKTYERTTSPLVQIQWWRLCLDEAQMIENGYSAAAEVARSIPRDNAWAITGTPVKSTINDLYGLLLFLGYQPYYSYQYIWDALIQKHKSLFQDLFNNISVRHTKHTVRKELLIPPQQRFVVTMPFTAVEEQHYQSMFKEMAEACQLSLEGAPLSDDWEMQGREEDLRRWLTRLRQTALHPEVGAINRRALGQAYGRPMRTVQEVLGVMLENSENGIRHEEREYLTSRLNLGQYYENGPRVEEARTIWEAVRSETYKLVATAKTRLQGYEASQPVSEAENGLKLEDYDLGASQSDGEVADTHPRKIISVAQKRLRSCLEMHHKAVFCCANAYFQIRDNPEMTNPGSEDYEKLKDLESKGYDEAKIVRRQILRESHGRAATLMNKISRRAEEQAFAVIPELLVGKEKGIESSRIIDELATLYGELNEQADMLDDMREESVKLLLQPLVDEDDGLDTTGEELGESATIQEELIMFMQILRALNADRQDCITGQTNELIKAETDTAMRLALHGEGMLPEKMVELLNKRNELRPHLTTISMRGAISELRTLTSRLRPDDADMSEGGARKGREAAEAKVVAVLFRETQALLTEQSKVAQAIEAEIGMFTAAMNARLDYYRQLQHLSDDVLPYDGPRTTAVEDRLQRAVTDHGNKLSSEEAKYRYLLNLKEGGSQSNEPRTCVICQSVFSVGVLTVCGHQFCKGCMMMWFKSHRNCPVCKKHLKASNLHDITYNPKQLEVRGEDVSRAAGSSFRSQEDDVSGQRPESSIYSGLNSEKLAEIKNIELDGPSFTTKVDTLVRHLLWLRQVDPGAKSIIFSQYKDFLTVLHNAFKRFRIGFASIDEKEGSNKFKEDPATEAFLLHARAHSSGLNLVNASHVFLCEPLLNTALELQAIARVDRIGQQHQTTVWLYVVQGTVEESIYDLSVRRRMEHMGTKQAETIRSSEPDIVNITNFDEANTLELEQASLSKLLSKDKAAGEMVGRDDLWQCLFGSVAKKTTNFRRDEKRPRGLTEIAAGESLELGVR